MPDGGGFSESVVLSRPQSVLFRATSGEAVLLDLATERYFALEAVGASFWSFVERGVTLGEAIDGVLDEYDVTRDVLVRDLDALVSSLVEAGLLEVTDG